MGEAKGLQHLSGQSYVNIYGVFTMYVNYLSHVLLPSVSSLYSTLDTAVKACLTYKSDVTSWFQAFSRLT